MAAVCSRTDRERFGVARLLGIWLQRKERLPIGQVLAVIAAMSLAAWAVLIVIALVLYETF
jgi:uncharacterized membrane-anchored protein YitT (DUF2179 family)